MILKLKPNKPFPPQLDYLPWRFIIAIEILTNTIKSLIANDVILYREKSLQINLVTLQNETKISTQITLNDQMTHTVSSEKKINE